MPIENISDGITAYLQGGLGNQLFIYAAAWQQAQRLQCPLYIDTSFYDLQKQKPSKAVTPREFEMGDLLLSGTVLSNSPWAKNGISRSSVWHPSIRKQGLKVHWEKNACFDSEIFKINVGTTIHGYFQSHKYFPNFAFRSIADPKFEKPKTGSTKRVSYHVRRGDYLSPLRNNHQILATPEFFKIASGTMNRLIGAHSKVIYSDSLEFVKKEFKSLPEFTYFEKQTNTSLELLYSISNAEGIVMSNSSLSWWAAWIMNEMYPDAPVIAPRPWMKNSNFDADLLLPGWITLGN